MGLFSVPTKAKDQMTPADYVDCAVENINLWREYPDATYLLEAFAIPMLQQAAAAITEQKEGGGNG